VGGICSQALCPIAAPGSVGSIGKELVNFDAYAAKR